MTIAMGYDAHRHHQAAKEREEHKRGVIGILGSPVHSTAQSVHVEDVPIPAQERRSCPCQGVEPDVGNGPPGPGEIDHSGMHHADITLIGQHSESRNGNKPCKKRKRSKVWSRAKENHTPYRKNCTENLRATGTLETSKDPEC